MIWIRFKRWVLLKTICKSKGHKNDYTYSHNGFKKGTFRTHNQKPLYQKKCDRCNRFFGKKIED